MLLNQLYIRNIIKQSEVLEMKLIVGLGNPGKQYENTRHNIGFYFLDNYVESLNLSWRQKFNSLYAETIVTGEKVIFLKPQTYMNNSGEAVSSFSKFYKINVSDILVISDDLDLPLGQYRLRSHGSCGGHNGLRNIEFNLQSDSYKRLKIGIFDGNIRNTVDYVLGKFTKEEMEVLDSLKTTISNILIDYFKMDFEQLMSRYNHRNRG